MDTYLRTFLCAGLRSAWCWLEASTSSNEGGDPENWLLQLNRGEYRDLEYSNYEGYTDNAPLTLKRRLPTAPFLYATREGSAGNHSDCR